MSDYKFKDEDIEPDINDIENINFDEVNNEESNIDEDELSEETDKMYTLLESVTNQLENLRYWMEYHTNDAHATVLRRSERIELIDEILNIIAEGWD